MNDKDFKNTYNSKPKNFAEHTNQATGAYTKTSESGNVKTENKDFFQTNIRYQAELAELAITEPAASAIFMLMVARMENNNIFITSKPKLAEAIHRSTDTVKRALKVLRERNFIAVYFRVNKNQGTAYFINPHICCKCSATQKQYLISNYLNIIDKYNTYRASEENIDVKALIEKDRLVLKSDEKRQLDTLNRLDNVKIHAMVEIPMLLKDKNQEEILEIINFLKDQLPLTEEEQKKTEQDIENRKKAIELMKERAKVIEEESEVTEELKMAEDKLEMAKSGKNVKAITDAIDALLG